MAPAGSRRALLFGAGGTLATELVPVLARSFDVVPVPETLCDIGDLAAVREVCVQAKAGVVVNAAAYTNVDGAEREVDAAYRVNAIGAENVALAAEQVGAIVVYYSTDFVFGGDSDRPYDEFDAPAPLSVYGRSKWAGERLTACACRRHLILRTGNLYGAAGKNFGSTLPGRLARGEPVRADATRRVAPTWARSLALQTARLLEGAAPPGTYHATSLGECSWFEFAQLAAKLGRFGARVEPMEASAVGVARRPARSSLSSRLLAGRGLAVMPPWQEALRDYLSSLGHLEDR